MGLCVVVEWNTVRRRFPCLLERAQAGRRPHRMFDVPGRVWTPFGWVLLVSIVVLAWQAVRDGRSRTGGGPVGLLVGLGLSTLGVWLLPDAVRIHHFLLLYPFPQLVIARAADPRLIVESRTNLEGRVVFQIFRFPPPP